jgi:hypothetical protein
LATAFQLFNPRQVGAPAANSAGSKTHRERRYHETLQWLNPGVGSPIQSREVITQADPTIGARVVADSLPLADYAKPERFRVTQVRRKNCVFQVIPIVTIKTMLVKKII